MSIVVLLQELESRVTPLNAEYWGCLLTLAEHELEAQRYAWAGTLSSHNHIVATLGRMHEPRPETWTVGTKVHTLA